MAAAETQYKWVIFRFRNADITCEGCTTIRAAARCHGLTVSDFEELEGIQVDEIDIEISFLDCVYSSEDEFISHLEEYVDTIVEYYEPTAAA